MPVHDIVKSLLRMSASHTCMYMYTVHTQGHQSFFRVSSFGFGRHFLQLQWARDKSIDHPRSDRLSKSDRLTENVQTEYTVKLCWICIRRIHRLWDATATTCPYSGNLFRASRSCRSIVCRGMTRTWSLSSLIAAHIRAIDSVPPYMITCPCSDRLKGDRLIESSLYMEFVYCGNPAPDFAVDAAQ